MARTLEDPALEIPRSRTKLVPAVVGRRSETGESSNLLAATDVTPGEELEGEEPGRLQTDAFEGHELTNHIDGGIGAGLELLKLESLDETDALAEFVAMLPLAQKTLVQLRRQRRGIPEAEFVEFIGEATGHGRYGQALRREQTLDAIGQAGALGLER